MPAERGTVPGSKDANRSAQGDAHKYDYASGTHKPQRANRPTEAQERADLDTNRYVPARTQADPVAANTTDPRTEDRSAPSARYPGDHSRSGASELSEAEKGSGRRCC